MIFLIYFFYVQFDGCGMTNRFAIEHVVDNMVSEWYVNASSNDFFNSNMTIQPLNPAEYINIGHPLASCRTDMRDFIYFHYNDAGKKNVQVKIPDKTHEESSVALRIRKRMYSMSKVDDCTFVVLT